jgi:hypothetical protein
MSDTIKLGFLSMTYEFYDLIKLALTTKRGLAVLTLCVFIYLTSLWISGGIGSWGLILGLLSLLLFGLLSWLIWFRVVKDEI